MSFSPIEASKHITDKYYRYLKTTFAMNYPYKAEYEKLIDQDILSKGPYLDVTDSFEKGKTLTELIDEGILPKSFSSINMNMSRPLYLHQEQALRKIVEEKSNLVVSTGTGSGKTESFLLPILRELLIEKEEGSLSPGIRALLVYPMNALANDQVERLRELLADTPEITFGVYTGQTKHHYDEALTEYKELNEFKLPQSNELISRDQMIDSPPHIFITNYAMLEYLMLRPNESVFFTGEFAGNWKYIVFDEAHVYNGSTGIEVSMLFRRLHAKLQSKELTYILTSATLGDKEDDEQVAEFAHSLCDADFSKNDVIRATRITPAPDDSLKVVPISFYSDLAKAYEEYNRAEDLCSLIPDCSADVFDSLYGIIVNDQNYWKIRKFLTSPKTVKEVSALMGWTSSQLNDFVTVASLAERNGAKLFDARYHMFIKATESIFVTLNPDNKVLLHRAEYRYDKDTDTQYRVFEAATCNYCNAVYLIGRIDKNYLNQCNTSDDISSKDVFLIADTVSDTDEDHLLESEGFKADEMLLCPYCGHIHKPGSKERCEHDPESYVKVFKATSLTEKRTLTKCLSCENVNTSGVLRMFFSGQEAATSVIGTALFEELPSYEIHIEEAVDDEDEFGFGSVEEKISKVKSAKQFIAFSDSRQAAAFYASYLSTTYNNILYKRLILEALKKVGPDSRCSVPELVDRVQTEFDSYDVRGKAAFDDRFGIQKEAWKAVLSELIDNNGNTSLTSVGLLDISVSTGLKLEKFNLSNEEFDNVCSEFIKTILTDAAVNYDGAPLNDSDIEDFAHSSVKYAYTLSDSSGKLRKSFIPTKAGLSNKRINYLERIIENKRNVNPDISEFNEEIAIKLLSQIWEKILVGKQILKSCDSNAYEVNSEKVSLKIPSHVYICSKCRKLTTHNVVGVCPSYQCDGELKEINIDELFANDHYYNLYQNLDIRDLRVVEHTAQLNRETAYEYQKSFKDKKIDVLSCSTTFEMGVDVGSLETVFMRNIPPMPSNYAQRAGRAGRSSKAAAFALTFCNKSSHDFTYFADPTSMIKGKINPPKYTVDNDRIAIRHLYASAFSFFWKIYNEYFGKISVFAEKNAISGKSGFDIFKEYLYSNPQDLKEYIKDFLPDSLVDEYKIETFGWVDNLVGERGVLTDALAVYYYELQLLKDTKQQLFVDNKPVDKITQRIKTYENENILTFLSRKNVLPKYGFPVDSVEMSVFDNKKGQGFGLELSRDLSMAISEYAPGSQIVANNNLITSRYIRRLLSIGWKTYNYITCPRCNTLNLKPFTGNDESDKIPFCSQCGTPFDETPKVFVIPEQGFEADGNSIRKPGLKKPERTYRGEINYVGFNVEADISRFAIGDAVVEVKTTHNDEMAVLNTSPFYVCDSCGYAVLDNKHFTKTLKHKHKNSSGRNCVNEKLVLRSLGYRFLTDVVKLSFLNHEIDSWEIGMSILHGILRGACSYLNIVENDISGCLQSYPTVNGLNYSIVIFDNTPGGSGHSKRLNDPLVLANVLKRTLAIMKNCNCGDEEADTSCYACLRNYKNQKYHDILKRRYVIDFLESVGVDSSDYTPRVIETQRIKPEITYVSADDTPKQTVDKSSETNDLSAENAKKINEVLERLDEFEKTVQLLLDEKESAKEKSEHTPATLTKEDLEKLTKYRRILVVDTNVVLDDPEFIYYVETNTFISIPNVVLQEVDKKKGVHPNAQRALKVLLDFDENRISYDNASPQHISSAFDLDRNNDNFILSVAACYKNESGKETILVTSDKGLQVKAKAEKILSLNPDQILKCNVDYLVKKQMAGPQIVTAKEESTEIQNDIPDVSTLTVTQLDYLETRFSSGVFGLQQKHIQAMRDNKIAKYKDIVDKSDLELSRIQIKKISMGPMLVKARDEIRRRLKEK